MWLRGSSTVSVRSIFFVVANVSLFVGCSSANIDSESTMNRVAGLIQTELGGLEGEAIGDQDGVYVFRGVPYAEPPVEELRWREPVKKASWKGIRSAKTFGPACWQPLVADTSIYTRGDLNRDEDCLYLNVWTGAEAASSAHPVMVWFHGGGHTGGWSSAKVFDGTTFAKKGVVLVTVNYRLGPFGFFSHPGLTNESPHSASGNYGLLDKISALEWVRDNISAFGGDSDNVTIFGQSAGAWSVCYLMASPLSKGLFHKAIGQSGGCFGGGRPRLSDAEEAGVSAAMELGIGGTDKQALRELRALDAETVLDSGLGSGAIVDGWFMPKAARSIFDSGQHNDVPVMVGAMANEGSTLYAETPLRRFEELVSMLYDQYGDHADELLSLYEAEIRRSTKKAVQEIQADQRFVWEMRQWARVVASNGSDAYLYFFSHEPPVFRIYVPDQPELDLLSGAYGYGAYHSGDLAYVFGNTHLVGYDWSEWDHELSNRMVDYWSNFAHTGNPNGDGLAEWPRYEEESDPWLEFGAGIRYVTGVRKEKLDLFDRVNVLPSL